MAAIPEGAGNTIAATGFVGRRDVAVSPQPSPRSGRDLPSEASGSGGVGRFGDLGRRYEARGEQWAEATRVRNLDRKLGRLADKISDVKIKLEQVKLYPPYPVNESRRAETIREFNGIAAEVKQLVSTSSGELPVLTPAVTGAEADQAAQALGQVQGTVSAQRTELVQAAASGDEQVAEASSVGIGSGLSGAAPAGITRQGANVLREIS